MKAGPTVTDDAPLTAPPRDVLVFGGGLLGAALARVASATGARVLVASRRSRPHAGLWRAVDASSLPGDLSPRGARVFLALAPARGDREDLWGAVVPRLAAWAWREGAATVTVCGPAGAGEAGADAFAKGVAQVPGGRTAVARLGPLFGQDDHCVWPLVKAVREAGVVKLPRGLPPMAPLWVEDAARAVWRLPPGTHTLRGPQVLTSVQIAEAIVRRFGGRWTWRLLGGRGDAARLAAQAELPDAWHEDALGVRTTVSTWVERLPGLRRKR